MPSSLSSPNRIEVYILVDRVASDNKELATILREIHETKLHDNGWTYREIPNDHRKTWWPAFLRRVYWDEALYPADKMKDVFYRSMSYAYSSRLSEYKKYFKKSKGTKIPLVVGERLWRLWEPNWQRLEEMLRVIERMQDAQSERERMFGEMLQQSVAAAVATAMAQQVPPPPPPPEPEA
ncbi:hypothetical protein CASFOL_034911 [Castilleja foliolosa]|uniref:Uncharacterized protein n=1 Tax=Castilleja foliolosa TaxID=1961234 RepID=A0ABD3BS35_9LAMI